MWNIILPIISIIAGLLYSKWLYKVNNGFFRKDVDLYSNVNDYKGWFAAITLIAVGALFLLKSII